jgi:hypothetical protein
MCWGCERGHCLVPALARRSICKFGSSWLIPGRAGDGAGRCRVAPGRPLAEHFEAEPSTSPTGSTSTPYEIPLGPVRSAAYCGHGLGQ